MFKGMYSASARCDGLSTVWWCGKCLNGGYPQFSLHHFMRPSSEALIGHGLTISFSLNPIKGHTKAVSVFPRSSLNYTPKDLCSYAAAAKQMTCLRSKIGTKIFVVKAALPYQVAIKIPKARLPHPRHPLVPRNPRPPRKPAARGRLRRKSPRVLGNFIS